MDPRELRRPETDAVLRYLYVEQLPSWRESESPWVVDGYSLTTHPDLCERVEGLHAAAGGNGTFRYLYGKPAVVAPNRVIVAFANGRIHGRSRSRRIKLCPGSRRCSSEP